MDSLSIGNTGSDAAVSRPFSAAVRDLGLPVFLFGVVFLLLTLGVTAVLSPDRFPVRTAGSVVRLSELTGEHSRLTAEKQTLEEERDTLLQSQDDAPVLQLVRERRDAMIPVGSVLLGVEAARASFVVRDIDPITLPVVSYDGSTHVLTLGGTVRDPAGGSSHLLSMFVDQLRALPFVTSVSEPEYIQRENPDGIPETPFTLTLRLSS